MEDDVWKWWCNINNYNTSKHAKHTMYEMGTKKKNKGKKRGTSKKVKKILNRIKMLKRESIKHIAKKRKRSLKVKY